MDKKEQFSQEQKLEVLKTAKGTDIRAAARIAGVHYTTVYDWRNRLKALGEEAFLKYQAPRIGRGYKQISEETEEAILEMWRQYPGFGPSQVRNQLRRQGITVSTRTVQDIMEANGYQVKRSCSKQKGKSQRFEASRPLELVQMDMLEFFIHKLKVYLILLLDDYSRFIVGWRLLSETSVDEAISVVQSTIERYGKMEEILTDRGFIFYSWKGSNRFEKYLVLEKVHHTHARAHHPQTLGKIEAVNKHIQKELIRLKEFSGISEAQESIDQWVEIHNYRRTHHGLGGFLVPADRFHGREKQVLKSISEGIDPGSQTCYDSYRIQRSLLSLVLEPEGGLRLNVLGKSIIIIAGSGDEEAINRRRGGNIN